MALVKCPECGKENVSDSAEACPDCGYGIKAHFKMIRQDEEKGSENTTGKSLSMIKAIVIIGIIIALLCCFAFYQESKCKGFKCDEMAVKNSRYCENHTCTTEGCYGYKDGWSNVCDTCHQRNMDKLEDDDTVQKLHDELVDKYGEDVFSDEMNMPDCNMSGCKDDGSGTYGGKWYCSKHLYEMQGYGNIISDKKEQRLPE